MANGLHLHIAFFAPSQYFKLLYDGLSFTHSYTHSSTNGRLRHCVLGTRWQAKWEHKLFIVRRINKWYVSAAKLDFCVSQVWTRILTNGILWSTGRTNTWSKAQTSSRSNLPSEQRSHAAGRTCWTPGRRPDGFHPGPCGTVPDRWRRACEGHVDYTLGVVRRHKMDHLYLTSRTVFSLQINRVYVYIICMCTRPTKVV